MTHEEKAKALFAEGYNCSQAVVLAFQEEIGLPTDLLARMASSLGGGMGRLREVCGAVSGMFVVCGFLRGYADPTATAEKAEHYARIQQLAAAFKQELGCNTIICRELLGAEGTDHNPTPSERTTAYYRRRPCGELVGVAARVLENYLQSDGK